MKNNFSYFFLLLFFIPCIQGHNYTLTVFGDSHIIFGFGLATNLWENTKFNFRIIGPDKTIAFHLNWLGPKTIHGAAKVDFASKIEQLAKDKLDALLFCFGEIDIRCHIEKQSIKQNRPIESIIEELVENFYNHLDAVRESTNLTIPFIIMTPIYPVGYYHIEVNRPRDDSYFPAHPLPDNLYPNYGMAYTRSKIAGALIESLQRNIRNGMYIFNPYTKYSENNFLFPEFSNDCCHFNAKSNQLIVDQLYNFLETLPKTLS